jgi:hypothetical protein
MRVNQSKNVASAEYQRKIYIHAEKRTKYAEFLSAEKQNFNELQ